MSSSASNRTKRELTAIDRLMQALERSSVDARRNTTSMRLPVPLRDAVDAAVDLGLETSFTDATVDALHDRMVALAQSLALEDHWSDHPHLKPTLARLAVVTAELDDNPLARDPELIERAAAALVKQRPYATPDDVLVYALALADPTGIT